MKAAKFVGNNTVEITDVPMPQIRENQILVKVAYCGLCGSEKRIVRSGFDKCTPGHEISGVVEQCGNDAKKLEKGTQVLIYLIDYCGKCPACLEGNTSQCSNRQGLIGWTFNGGYAEYVAVPDHMVFPIGDIPLELGVIALDTVGTAFHGLRQGDFQPGNSAMVIGCGPIGLGCISILKNFYNVTELYAADISPFRCEMAAELGAKAIQVDPADTAGSIGNALQDLRIDRVVEVAGLNDTLAAAVKFVRPGGKVIYIGEPEVELKLVRSADWVLKDFSLLNSWYFPIREIEENLAYIRKYPGEMRSIITDYFPLEEMTAAYRKFHSGQTGKVLIRL